MADYSSERHAQMGDGGQQPNILFIMTDQQRFDYLGCAGADHVRTPNIDSLAAGGMRFQRCFTNAPICAASRISLATGRHAYRTGALDNGSYLPQGLQTYYQRLRRTGYRVGCVGKLDLAKPSHYNGRFGDRPPVFEWGFTHPEECEGKMHAGQSATPQGPYTYYLQECGLLQSFYEDYRERARAGWLVGASHDSVLPADAFEDAYIGKRAADWIANVPDDFPWHLFVSFVGPHDPFDPPSSYADRYRNAKMPAATDDTMTGKPAWVKEKQVPAHPDEVSEMRRQYCAAIQLIDDQVGMIVNELDRRGMSTNTYIIFSSDHGEMLGDHGLYRKGLAYEQASRIPLIVTGPSIEPGQVTDAMVDLMDVNPTICELAGLPRQEAIDARSFVPTLSDAATTHRRHLVIAQRNFRCIRTDRHKLIENYNDAPELYDLDEDSEELANVAPSHPELVETLTSDLRRSLQRAG